LKKLLRLSVCFHGNNCMDCIRYSNSERGPHKKYYYEVLSILTKSFRRRCIWKKSLINFQLVAMVTRVVDWYQLNFINSESGSHMEHSCEVLSKLIQWFLGESILKFLAYFLSLPWQPEFSRDWNYFINLGRRHHKKHICKVKSHLRQWLKIRYILKQNVNKFHSFAIATKVCYGS